MSPFEFNALAETWRHKEARMQRRFAILSCIVANKLRGDAAPLEVSDFMEGLDDV